ncbi:MAG: ribosomal protein S18-alanine N-acetyltransferase, partial [Pseudomonadota bacterium]
QLCNASTQDSMVFYAIESRINKIGWSLKNFNDCLSGNYICKKLCVNKKIIGYLIVQDIVDECHILNIGIDVDAQRKGYGQYLMSDLLKICHQKSHSIIMLEVRESNEKAQNFYRKNGFYEIGFRKNYYPMRKNHKREAAILMAKYL